MKKNSIDAIVGKRVRERRTLEGLSQVELAGALGLTFQQVQKYENATNRISASALVLIARRLNCKVADFFVGIDQGDENFAEVPLSAEAIKLARRYDAVRDPTVRAIMQRTLGAFEKEARPARELAHVR